MFAYCGNNPTLRVDPEGMWWLEDALDWTCENVFDPVGDFFGIVGNNISASAGFCIGFGGEVEISGVKVGADMREDIIGVRLQDGNIDVGNNGKSGASVGIGNFGVNNANETFESWTNGERYVYEDDNPNIEVGFGVSASCFVGFHFDFSLSLSGFWDDLCDLFS